MRKKFLILFLLLILFYSPAEASNGVLVVRGLKVKPHEDALKGFKDTCNCSIKELTVSESNYSDILKKIRKINPDMVLAIGVDVLSWVKRIKDIPIVYLMVLNPQSILSGEENITGISMNITPEKQLCLFQKALPDIKKIGLLFDPTNTGHYIKRVKDTAGEIGVKLIIKEVHGPREVPSLLNGMKGEIDAFWMLPDTSVISSETIEFLILFSIENRIPVFTFSEKFLEMGALISLNIDASDLGKQAGEMAKEILSGKDIRNIPGSDARKIVLSINSKVAKKLGITINDEIVNKAIIVH